VGALLFDVGGGDDLGGKMEPFAKIVEAFGSEGVVVPLPGELSLQVAAGGERLTRFDNLSSGLVDIRKPRHSAWVVEFAYVEVLGINFIVLWEVEVLLRDKHTLCAIMISEKIQLKILCSRQ